MHKLSLALCIPVALARIAAADPQPSVAKSAPKISSKQHTRRIINDFVPPVQPFSSEHMEKQERAEAVWHAGEVALKAKDLAGAEYDFRASLRDMPYGEAYLGLAEVLAAQGHTSEAIQTYRVLFHPGEGQSFGGSYLTRAKLEYALLLNQTGQWPEAVTVYETTLPDLPARSLPDIGAHFDPALPQPTQLEAATHVALGRDANWTADSVGEFDHARAFQEYAKARQITPDWPVANYYYGYGWQRLDPKTRTKAASAEQIKAALQKAAALGEGDVKKAAAVALTGFK